MGCIWKWWKRKAWRPNQNYIWRRSFSVFVWVYDWEVNELACVNLIPPPRSRAWVGFGMNVGAEASLIVFIWCIQKSKRIFKKHIEAFGQMEDNRGCRIVYAVSFFSCQKILLSKSATIHPWTVYETYAPYVVQNPFLCFWTSAEDRN